MLFLLDTSGSHACRHGSSPENAISLSDVFLRNRRSRFFSLFQIFDIGKLNNSKKYEIFNGIHNNA